jgi:hypothetical protein
LTEGVSAAQIASLVEVQKYNRSIHIMAMLLVGFGFLMVFVKKYGRSAVTATYLLVSVAILVYFLVNGMGIFGKPEGVEIDKFILAEFAAASLLICAGTVLGRLKMSQYMALGVIFVLCYMFNEWIVLKGIDTCGVLNLHGWPGLMGGVAAIFVIGGIDKIAHFKGIAITIVIALAAGFVAGKALAVFGRKAEVYVDSDEFADAE